MGDLNHLSSYSLRLSICNVSTCFLKYLQCVIQTVMLFGEGYNESPILKNNYLNSGPHFANYLLANLIALEVWCSSEKMSKIVEAYLKLEIW